MAQSLRYHARRKPSKVSTCMQAGGGGGGRAGQEEDAVGKHVWLLNPSSEAEGLHLPLCIKPSHKPAHERP